MSITSYLYWGDLVSITGYNRINLETALIYEVINSSYIKNLADYIIAWHGLNR